MDQEVFENFNQQLINHMINITIQQIFSDGASKYLHINSTQSTESVKTRSR